MMDITDDEMAMLEAYRAVREIDRPTARHFTISLAQAGRPPAEDDLPRSRAAIAIGSPGIDGSRDVVIGFLPSSGLSGALRLSAPQLLSLIQALGQTHATLGAGGPKTLHDQDISTIYDPLWYTQINLSPAGSFLGFYHPSFGPVGFIIPFHEVKRLRELMAAQMEEGAKMAILPKDASP
jgi:hypothetical protein